MADPKELRGDNLLAARFWSKVNVRTPKSCWEWRGSLVGGYGTFRVGPKVHKAHRVAWMLSCDAEVGDLHVLHRCDNPRCCNPAHLFLGTNADNVADKVSKGRQAKGLGHGVPGARNKQAKLTPDRVLEAKELLANGNISQREVAQRFGVSQSAISLIVLGKNWARPDAFAA